LGGDIIKFCIFGDAAWWHRVKWDLEKFTGKVVTNAPSLLHLNVPYMLKMGRVNDGLQNGGSSLSWNYSTGALAINLAVVLGARKVYLLGYDLTTTAGQSHWHNHGKGITPNNSFQRFLRGFRVMAGTLKTRSKPVEAFNVTDGSSKLDCFKRITFAEFEEVLK
jgi:hypothetical protein